MKKGRRKLIIFSGTDSERCKICIVVRGQCTNYVRLHKVIVGHGVGHLRVSHESHFDIENDLQ